MFSVTALTQCHFHPFSTLSAELLKSAIKWPKGTSWVLTTPEEAGTFKSHSRHFNDLRKAAALPFNLSQRSEEWLSLQTGREMSMAQNHPHPDSNSLQRDQAWRICLTTSATGGACTASAHSPIIKCEKLKVFRFPSVHFAPFRNIKVSVLKGFRRKKFKNNLLFNCLRKVSNLGARSS